MRTTFPPAVRRPRLPFPPRIQSPIEKKSGEKLFAFETSNIQFHAIFISPSVLFIFMIPTRCPVSRVINDEAASTRVTVSDLVGSSGARVLSAREADRSVYFGHSRYMIHLAGNRNAPKIKY